MHPIVPPLGYDQGDRMKILFDMFHIFLFVRPHTKFCIKIFEIDFVIEKQMIFDLLAAPQAPLRRGQKCAVACPIYLSNSNTKFGWISSNG